MVNSILGRDEMSRYARLNGKLIFEGKYRAWAPPCGLPWGQANRLGARYAEDLLDFVYKRPDRAPVLGHVAHDIARRGIFGGVEVGFFHRLALKLSED